MGAASNSDSAECFSKMMASMPGFRFHPTDEELVMYYLKRKMCGKKLKLDVIHETDVYKWDPEELPGQSILKTGDRQWFFFSPRDRRYPNGARSNRATAHGYWKATGKDRNITCNSQEVGVKKTLVFYRGRAPNGERTDWVMHEYTLDEEELKRCQGVKDYHALCKVYKKSGPGPKNGEQYGAPFKEEDWADDDFVDFNIKRDDQKVPNGVAVTDQLPPLFDDDLGEIIKRMVDTDPMLDQQHMNVYPDFPQVAAEETQSAVVDQFSQEVMFPEGSINFHSSNQQYDVQPSFDFNQSVTSDLHVSEAPEVTSSPNIQREERRSLEDDFLEINDLIGDPIGPEPMLSNMENPLENLQFEDGLSEFDLYHDAEMFIRDTGLINLGTVSHTYMNTLDSNIVNQNNQLLPNPVDANQTGGEFWMHGQRNIVSPAEAVVGFSSLPTPGVVYESASFPTEGNENQSSTVGGVAASSFSSALWAFVESIPTNPASASENALVNRAIERMSSFSRATINIKHTNVAAGNDTATMKRAGGKGSSFLFFPILVALCAFLWVSIGTLRLSGTFISS